MKDDKKRILWLGIFTGAWGFWVVFGMTMAWLISVPGLQPVFGPFWSPFFGTGSLSPQTQALVTWFSGLVGAIMVSWSLLALALTWIPLRKGEAWAWWALLISVLAWFSFDEAYSVAFGVVPNAVGNLVLLVWFLGPLAVLRPTGRS